MAWIAPGADDSAEVATPRALATIVADVSRTKRGVEAGVSPAAIAADTAASTADILGFAMTVSPLILT